MKKHIILIEICILTLSFNVSNAQYNWLQKANYGPGTRTRACGFAIGGKGYILTGDNGSGTYYNDVWAYDSATNTWSSKNTFGGTARFVASACSIGGHGYVFCGRDVSGFKNDVWEYTPSTDTWTPKKAFPGGARYCAVAIADSANGKIYFGCGDNGGGTYLSDWWEYDPSTDTWTAKAAFAGGSRSWPAGFSVGGEVYVGTGNDQSVNLASSDWWKYDPGTDTWTSRASVPGNPRRDAACFVINGNGYICTGLEGSSVPVSMNDLWMYNASSNTWTSEANYGGGKINSGVGFAIGNSGYVGTGWDSTLSSPISGYWRYRACSSGPSAINETDQVTNNVTVFPNPGHGTINFSFYRNEQKKVTIEITDIYGRIVDVHDNVKADNSSVRLDESLLSAGVYFYRISDAGKLLANGKFIIVK